MDTENRSEISIIDEMLREIMHANYQNSEQSYELWFGRLQLRRLSTNEAYLVCENELKRKIITEKFTDYIASCLAEVIGYEPIVTIGVDTDLAPVIPDDGTVISPLKILRERQAAREEREETDEKTREDLTEMVRDIEEDYSTYEDDEIHSFSFAYDDDFYHAVSDDERKNADIKFDPTLAGTPEPPIKKDNFFVYNEDYTFDKFIVGSSNSFAHAAAINVANNVGMNINPLFIYFS